MDQAGNVSDGSGLTVTIDRIAPAQPVLNATGPIAADNYVNDSERTGGFTLTFSSADPVYIVPNATGYTSKAQLDADPNVIVSYDSDGTATVGETEAVDGTVYAAIAVDAAGNVSNNKSTKTFTYDITPPLMDAVETVDNDVDNGLDANGYLDAVHIIFSENILDATVVADDFDVEVVSDESFTSTTHSDTADDDDIYITFTEGTAWLTDGLPEVTYTVGASGALTDHAGNPLAKVNFTSTTDTSGPAILYAYAAPTGNETGLDSGDTVVIGFSEAIANTATFTDAYLDTDIDTLLDLDNEHTWRQLPGTNGIQNSSTEWLNSATLRIGLLDPGVDGADVAPNDKITVSDAFIDAASNTSETPDSAADRVPIIGTFDHTSAADDGSDPSISTLETADTNGDGTIDRLILTASEPIFIRNPGNFSINLSFTIESVTEDTVTGDEVIWVNLSGGSAGTDLVPELDPAADAFIDWRNNGNGNDPAFPSVDKAPPVLISAVGFSANGTSSIFDGINDTLTLTFSEILDDTIVPNAAQLETDLFFYDAVAEEPIDGTNLPGAVSVAIANGTSQIVITQNAGSGPPDGSSPTYLANGTATGIWLVANSGNVIKDVAGNFAVATTNMETFSHISRPPIMIVSPDADLPASTPVGGSAIVPPIKVDIPLLGTAIESAAVIRTDSLPPVWSTPNYSLRGYRADRSILDLIEPKPATGVDGPVVLDIQPRPSTGAPEAPTHDRMETAQSSTLDPAPLTAPGKVAGESTPVGAQERTNVGAQNSRGSGEKPVAVTGLPSGDFWFLGILFLVGIAIPLGYFGLRRILKSRERR